MANVLPRDLQITVLHHLLEGNTLRSTTRLTGVHRTTIANLMVNFGGKCQDFMDREFSGLKLRHVEVDEIWSYVGKKQARLTVDEKQERADAGDVYLWYGIDQQTKLAPCFVVGKRNADNARRLLVQLAGRLEWPTAHQSDPHGYQAGGYKPIVQISTDGFSAYPEAVDLAFGPYAKFGTIVKDYRDHTMPGKYTPAEMVATQRRGVFGIDAEQVWSICTSHVERANLTIRTLMKRFTRLGLGFSKKLENHVAACAMYFAYYNWCWRTRYPDDSGKCGRLRPPAAMLAGVTDRLWTFEDLFDAVMAS